MNKTDKTSTFMELIMEGQENRNIKQRTVQIISDAKGKFQGVNENTLKLL